MINQTNNLKMTLKSGEVIIKLLPEVAPQHVARVKELVASGFYDGLSFHRVVEGFIAQTGCPNGDGTGRSGVSIKAEFSDYPFTRGVVAMARGVNIDSADSQFFILLQDSPKLKGTYSIFGEVVSGMEHIDALKKGTAENNHVINPDKIIKLELM